MTETTYRIRSLRKTRHVQIDEHGILHVVYLTHATLLPGLDMVLPERSFARHRFAPLEDGGIRRQTGPLLSKSLHAQVTGPY